MLLLLFGILSPIISALFFHSLIYNYRFIKLITFLFFGITTLYLVITTTGHEGPIYRLYVCIITFLLFVFEIVTLCSNKEKIGMKLIYLVFLLVTVLLLFFSNGVCNFI